MREVHTLFKCMGLHMRQPLKWLHMRESLNLNARYRSCNKYVSQHHGIVPDTPMRIQLLALVPPAGLRRGRQGRGRLMLHGAESDEGNEKLATPLASILILSLLNSIEVALLGNIILAALRQIHIKSVVSKLVLLPQGFWPLDETPVCV